MTIKPGDYQFNCPKCEGHYYTSSPLYSGKFMRQCSGGKEPCIFAWHEDEDFKWFVFIIRFTDRQEHDYYWRLYRNTLEDMINRPTKEDLGGQEESKDRESKTGTEEEGGCSADFPCSSCSCFGTP